METTKENRKPTAIGVTKKSDLEKLIPGDVFQLSFDPHNNMGLFVRYVGKVKDKIEVMVQDDEDYEKIVGVKIHPDNILFTEEEYKGYAEALVVMIDKEDKSEYLPSSPGYQERLDLFKATFGWINPKTAKRTLNAKYLAREGDNAIALVSFNSIVRYVSGNEDKAVAPVSFSNRISKVLFPPALFENAGLKEGDYFTWTAYPIRCSIGPSDLKASKPSDEFANMDLDSIKEVFDLDDFFSELRQDM